MKKVFKFALVAFAAAAVAVACNKPAADPTPTPTPDPDPDPQPEEVVPVEGNSDWSVTGALLGTNWDKDYVCAEENGAFVLKNVKLTATDEFKFRKGKAWDENRGGAFESLNNGFAVVQDGTNIKPGLDGVYDLYLLADLTQAAVCAKGVSPEWQKAPEAQSWDYVMDISDYKTNSEFHFTGDVLSINPASVTVQWKFYATKWNDYDKVDEERGYKVWCNRLGQISNEQEKGFLFRFNDGGQKGSLRFNSDLLGNHGAGYVGSPDGNSGNQMYIWDLNVWHVLTIVADGTNVTIYDNGEKVDEYAENIAPLFANGLSLQRFDISMTWDDGTGYDKGQAFQGYQAFTRIWSKALSADEVAASLCDVPADSEGLEIYWAWNLDEGSVVNNLAKKAGYNLDFATAIAGGQQSNVNPDDIEGTWTPAAEFPVCAE